MSTKRIKEELVMLSTLLISVGLVMVIAGCSVTDKIYGVGKTIYIGGKEVVIQNADLLDKETLNRLDKLDDAAARYDSARSVIREGK